MVAQLSLRDRVRACLLFGALGNAWGVPYEDRRTAIDFHIPERQRISDDSLLTIATCESIIERNAVDPSMLHRDSAISLPNGLDGARFSILQASHAAILRVESAEIQFLKPAAATSERD